MAQQQTPSNRTNLDKISMGLGWFSIGLGLAEIIAPRALGRWIGIRKDHSTVLRAYGAREIGAGIGILAQPRGAHWFWARMAGDAVDIASLIAAMGNSRNDRGALGAALGAVGGVTALDIYTALAWSRGERAAITGEVHVVKTTAVNRSPEECYRFWRNFENLPRFMSHLKSVEVFDGGRSYWKAKAPAGMSVEWTAAMVDDQAPHRIAWRTMEGSDIDHTGNVRFTKAPGDRGTIVRVEMRYKPPAGAAGAALAKLFGTAPEQQIEDDLRAFKQILEVGEVTQSDASAQGPGMHAAQPPRELTKA